MHETIRTPADLPDLVALSGRAWSAPSDEPRAWVPAIAINGTGDSRTEKPLNIDKGQIVRNSMTGIEIGNVGFVSTRRTANVLGASPQARASDTGSQSQREHFIAEMQGGG